MQLTVTIDLKHRAFDEGQGVEVASTLRKLAERIETLSGEDIETFSTRVHDTCGVAVCTAEVTP
ncbi:hypothetical protein [Luteibacter aegosomatissinici]|uniref:hypothetical protein n=1 Tax=Luteibacter aegosomatissinici TaxID=2911539 RepID=UPI001FF90E9E|nr:hypothetical protein [Luteibacter aegosomatissinici]UPG92800.1 hypothetical protein L2Y97_13090 [Luteibacter aegosomatissinici]